MNYPPGLILFWSGTLASIPSGWVLCDGNNGSPNLRSKFAKGAAASANPGATGGATTHTHANHAARTHTGGGIGNHSNMSHSGTSISNHSSDTATTSPPQIVAISDTSHSITEPSTHTGDSHSFTEPTTHTAQTHSTNSSEPVYYALIYIMKT
jgi:hypothetical protein